MASDGQAPICGLDGNPDLTGLGIRAAFYIQSVTFAVAGEFLHQEAAFLHSSAIVLLLAILVALVRETIMGSLHAPEVAVIMWLFAVQIVASGQTFVKSTSVMRATMGIPPPTADLARIRIHLSVVFAYVGYATWFWFAGLDTLPRTPCEEYGFFFTKVDIRGWFRTVNKVVYSLICVFTGLYAAFIALAWIYYGIGQYAIRARLRLVEHQGVYANPGGRTGCRSSQGTGAEGDAEERSTRARPRRAHGRG